ncbi:CRTAC1 family protein [Roseiflexus sp.]|uniref:CRTAC1 family protein n=3 Tax=Roseiflexus sp. TaxID=2562120 RepID=UPI00398AC739
MARKMGRGCSRASVCNLPYDAMMLALCSVVVIGAGCAGVPSAPFTEPPASRVVAARVETLPLSDPQQPCSSFIAHDLPHITRAAPRIPALYESNGSGLAVGDLDGDGDLDIVLADLSGPSTLLWNEGNLQFRAEPLGEGRVRGLTIVDVDGDELLDIVATRQFDKPVWWRNTGMEGVARFEEMILPDVNNWFYTLTFADLDGDGDLDLIAASYDTEIQKQQGLIFQYRGGGVGVFVYERHGASYRAYRLSNESDALAIALPDLNSDGRRDIWVAHDFNRLDDVWLQGDTLDEWTRFELPERISENPMSLDMGDIDNDGVAELFATDMKPVRQDAATLARWLPAMRRLTKPLSSADPQHAENMLLVRRPDGRWRNEAYERRVDATGWSWSGVFGDLDRDGWLDLYVVNGMIAAGLLDYLPDSELVDDNVALRNVGNGHFVAAPEWELGSSRSGRGMVMADLDGDGDLDIVVNNLMTPAQLFENRLCGGASLLVDLRMPGNANPFAVGAELTLITGMGRLTRDVRVTAGYLSGASSRVHFGFPDDVDIERLEVRWPDGAFSIVEAPLPQQRLLIVRQ